MRPLLAAALLLGLLVAGCTDAPGPTPGADKPGTASTDAGADPDTGTVLGVVLDAILRPVPGASVEPTEPGLATTTGDDGRFLLRLPPGEHALRITAPGFRPHAETVEVHAGQRVGVNVTLDRLPSPPRVEVQSFTGFIHCDVILQPTHSHGNNHTHNNQRCDAPLADGEHVWDIPLRAGVDGLVVELAWEPNTELSGFLYVRIEAADGTLVADTESASPLRLQVAQGQLHERVPDGGSLRMVALVGTGDHAGGNDLGLAVQFQQEFEAFASAFYGQPSSPDYSLLR